MLKKMTRGMTAGMTRRGVGFAVAGGGGYDTDAQAYITAVESADGQSLETGVKDAINAFVVGCKSDGIWTAIKASCILAGARTLSGALVPLVGTAPTNNNFVSGDYSRTGGLTGDGITKYLNTNRLVVDDPQDNCHVASFVTVQGSSTDVSLGASELSTTGSVVLLHTNPISGRHRNDSYMSGTINALPPSFAGFSRSLSSQFEARANGISETIVASSTATGNTTTNFLDTHRYLGFVYRDTTLAFYSIGEALDLADLDTRVTTLITDIGTALA